MVTSSLNDVAIIGAGPVGLFTIFACGMQKLHCHVLEVLPHIGGQCGALYPEKPIYDIPGFPYITAAGLIENLSAQAAPFHPTYHLGHQVTHVQAIGGGHRGFQITTHQGLQLKVGAVIIAGGVGGFGPNQPPLKDLEAFEGKSVFYSLLNKSSLQGKRVVIAGGGDSAVDWTLALAGVAQHISVVHRRDKFRASPESVSQLEHLHTTGKIDLVIPYQLHELEGDIAEGRLHAVHVESLDGQKKRLPADVLLPFYGLSMNLGPILEWGLSLENNGIHVEPASTQTNHPGIFAVGDMAHYPGKLKLILTGFAEAAVAAHSCRTWIYPDEVRHFNYSTTTGIPQDVGEA